MNQQDRTSRMSPPDPELIRRVRAYIEAHYAAAGPQETILWKGPEEEPPEPKKERPGKKEKPAEEGAKEELPKPRKIELRDGVPVLSDLSPEAFPGLQEAVRHVGETFQERLLRLIDARGLTDAEVYRKAGIDRKLFSKIRCSKDYRPGKRTAIALAIALELNLDETVDLLGRAGFALSPSSRSDLIIEYCIRHGIYDMDEINGLLYEFGEPLLGS